MATERRRAKVKQQRADWFRHRLPAIAALPERVVFIDETAVKTNLTRLRGRALRGERLIMDAPFGSWGTQTLIAGLTQDALIAPWVSCPLWRHWFKPNGRRRDGWTGLCRLYPRSAGS